LTFRFHPLRFHFTARERIHFAPGRSSNLLRGAFGMAFRRRACEPDCPGARTCPQRGTCPYARVFEPSPPADSPSGLADPPRPFVFRASHLDGLTLAPGDPFHFDFNLFLDAAPLLTHLTQAFAALERADFVRVDASPDPTVLSLDPPAETVSGVTVRFVTPTELKGHDGLLDRPDFGILASRIRDRISTLRELYGDGPLDLDFRAFGERAAKIRMTRCELQQVAVERRSSRTGQTHSLGGFTGEADFEGDLTEFVPYLEAARWTGVGRQTVWGKGEIHVTVR
jgi:hypothetical protein